MNGELQTTFLRAMACLFVLAGLVHLWRVLVPHAADPSGPLRHAVFVGINLGAAACLWVRPPWFTYAFGVLVLQQLYSHGGSAWRAWNEQHQIDAVSWVIVVLLPLTWAVLWRQSDGGNEIRR
jgi:hypothetical protein